MARHMKEISRQSGSLPNRSFSPPSEQRGNATKMTASILVFRQGFRKGENWIPASGNPRKGGAGVATNIATALVREPVDADSRPLSEGRAYQPPYP
jgi:hypothetical protein